MSWLKMRRVSFYILQLFVLPFSTENVDLLFDQKQSLFPGFQLNGQAFMEMPACTGLLRPSGDTPDNVIFVWFNGEPFGQGVHPWPVMLKTHIDAMSRNVEDQFTTV